jgi:rfaE bifunctional protein kinase chain/domain
MSQFKELFQRFSEIPVLVLGDLMLDSYWWGHVDRISPEAPVPIVRMDSRELRIGGAGNVALNLVALNAPVQLLSVIGRDEDGDALIDLLGKKGIGTGSLLRSDQRITTSKTRIISRNQQMLRLDSESTMDLSSTEEDSLLDLFKETIHRSKPRVLILEDYNKGLLTPRVIREAIELCRKEQILTAVDPKSRNFFAYQGVDIFKPNLKEVREGLSLALEPADLAALRQVHDQLIQRLHHRISLVTLSEKGVFFQEKDQAKLLPSYVRRVSDVSGAGDTVIAVASLVFAATGESRLMAAVANIAGGLVCEEVGTGPVNRDQLLQECELLLS